MEVTDYENMTIRSIYGVSSEIYRKYGNSEVGPSERPPKSAPPTKINAPRYLSIIPHTEKKEVLPTVYSMI